MSFKGLVCVLALAWIVGGCRENVRQTTATQTKYNGVANELIEMALTNRAETVNLHFVSPENMANYFQGVDEKVVTKFKPELTRQAKAIKKGQLKDFTKLAADLKNSGVISGNYKATLISDKVENIGRNLEFTVQVAGTVKAMLLISGYKVTKNGYLMARISSVASKDLRRQ